VSGSSLNSVGGDMKGRAAAIDFGRQRSERLTNALGGAVKAAGAWPPCCLSNGTAMGLRFVGGGGVRDGTAETTAIQQEGVHQDSCAASMTKVAYRSKSSSAYDSLGFFRKTVDDGDASNWC